MNLSSRSSRAKATNPAPPASAAPPDAARLRLPAWLPPLFYLLLALAFLWRSFFGGDVFLPAGLLGHVFPWSAQMQSASPPPWNPLRWDGIAQFYPWRHFAAQTLRAGTIPLWNPYQFCGTPFLANSQSAVLYPGNLLFYLLPTAQAFGVSALLHLTLCGWFAYLLLRRLSCAGIPALLGGVVYAFSAWQVAWLQLPTFLAVSCWFPLLLRQACVVADKDGPTFGSVAGLGAVVGMVLLAGHLQIAFYGLLMGGLWTLALLIMRGREQGVGAALRGLAGCAAGLGLGVMLAAPQILPALELSRQSHRVGKPTAAGYQAYTEYALSPAGLVTLTLPDFFGNDYDRDNPYWGFYIKKLNGDTPFAIRHNAAETALFVGIVPLLLGGLALLRGLRRGALDRRVLFFGGLAALALLLALGTPLDALFYFGVPGFGQSGSPARSLVLWALAWAALAAFGLDTLLRQPPTRREILLVGGGFAFVFAIGLSLAAQAISKTLPGFDALKAPVLGEAFGRIGADWIRLGVAFAGGVALLLPEVRQRLQSVAPRLSLPALGPLLLVIAELFFAGINANPTAPLDYVYPMTPGLTWLKAHADPHARIFPVNRRWSLYKAPPAVLPPNAATVYELRDVQGYDSLFTGQYKAFANQFALPNQLGLRDASPPEVGNMVFFQNANAIRVSDLAAYALTPPTDSPAFSPEAAPHSPPLPESGDDMAIYPLPHAEPRAILRPLEFPAYTPAAPVWKEDGPTRVTITTEATYPTRLILQDQFYPGWRATVDDHPVPIAPSINWPFREVAVPAGTHVVSFRYEPVSFRFGLYLGCLACLLIALLSVASFLRGQNTDSSRNQARP